MYEVDLETHPDIPGFEDVAIEPFEGWMVHNMQRPTDSPEATFIALADEEAVGFAKLSLTAPTAAPSPPSSQPGADAASRVP